MRNSGPLQWIEEAEARQVLTKAVSERKELARHAAPWRPRQLMARLRLWLTPGRTGWQPFAAHPVPVVGAAYRRHAGRCDEECPRCW